MAKQFVSMWRQATGAQPPADTQNIRAEDIAALAYAKFLQRQFGAPRDPMHDWLEAEAELRGGFEVPS
jgi:hypothetical protein